MPCGYDKDAIVKALWAGTYAMVENDGTCTNEERFWQSSNALLGDTTTQMCIRDRLRHATMCAGCPNGARTA